MSIQLGSELITKMNQILLSLAPISFNLGSELKDYCKSTLQSLTPMSFNLGSEPLFSNLYLIVT